MASETIQQVFRDLIEEEREHYSVAYQPADARSPIALVSLYFTEAAAKDLPAVNKAMEAELVKWLEKFPVPVKISPYTTRKRSIRLSPNSDDSSLMGYVRLEDSAIVRRWGSFADYELPAEALEPSYLEDVYSKVPFRVREEDRALARAEFWLRMRQAAAAVGLILLFPASLQAALRWGQEFALPVMFVSAGYGIYKGARVLGWRGPSRWEHRRMEILLRKEHYYYHCETNPTAFARLEQANHKREVSQMKKETRQLVEKIAQRRKERRNRSWFFLPRFLRAKS